MLEHKLYSVTVLCLSFSFSPNFILVLLVNQKVENCWLVLLLIYVDYMGVLYFGRWWLIKGMEGCGCGLNLGTVLVFLLRNWDSEKLHWGYLIARLRFKPLHLECGVGVTPWSWHSVILMTILDLRRMCWRKLLWFAFFIMINWYIIIISVMNLSVR
jgi:hypothetical protein